MEAAVCSGFISRSHLHGCFVGRFYWGEIALKCPRGLGLKQDKVFEVKNNTLKAVVLPERGRGPEDKRQRPEF